MITEIPLATKGVYKYEYCPVWHRENQHASDEELIKIIDLGIPVNDPFIVTLANAVHLTVDATGFSDAIDKLNRSMMISPMATALGAFGQFCMASDTGYKDIRFASWKISHETRNSADLANGLSSRVGLPDRYFGDLFDYFSEVLSYPFVLAGDQFADDAFNIGNGLFWRDARLKFFPDKNRLGVEFRPIATQPTAVEDVALTAFYLGRLMWSQKHNEPLMDMSLIKSNKSSAEKCGMSGWMSFQTDSCSLRRRPTAEVLDLEIKRAVEGLIMNGMSASEVQMFSDVWNDRVRNGSPAEQLERQVKSHTLSGMDQEDALIQAVTEYCLE